MKFEEPQTFLLNLIVYHILELFLLCISLLETFCLFGKPSKVLQREQKKDNISIVLKQIQGQFLKHFFFLQVSLHKVMQKVVLEHD